MSAGAFESASLAALDDLTPAHFLSLAHALEAGTLTDPYSVPALRRIVPDARVDVLQKVLGALKGRGVAPMHVALLARAIAAERERAQHIADRVALVWTGPEVHGSETRDTSVVVRELFDRARETVLVAGYVVHGGKALFQPLAEKMDANPALSVRIFLNITRQDGDERDDVHVVSEFAKQFAKDHWPGERAPQLFHDPRGLAFNKKDRAVLHAKCVVVDDEVAFVTSANLTGAAQYRNMEAGVLIEDVQFAKRLRRQFDVLVEHGHLQHVPWPFA